MSTEDEKLKDQSELSTYAYWDSETLKLLNPKTAREYRDMFFVIAVLVLGLGAGIAFAGDYFKGTSEISEVVFRFLPIALAVGVTAGIASWVIAGILDHGLTLDQREGRRRREPLARQIREYASRQERFRRLLTMHPPQWKSWALERHVEVFKEWPVDFDQFDKLRSDTEYAAAVHDNWPGYGVGSTPFEGILHKRLYIYNWARYESTAEERAKAGIARDEYINREEKLASERLRRTAEEMFGEQDSPRIKRPWD